MSEKAAHKTLAEALLAAQQGMPAVDRDGTNPHFKSKFTTLDNLLSKVRPVLNRHDLVLVQAPDLRDGQFVLKTTLLHSGSGESMHFDAPLAPPKNDPQGQGSAITYMRRYALAAALAIADQEDDDGNAATNSQQAEAQPSSSGATGFVSDKQRRFFEGKLKSAGVGEAGRAAVCEYLLSRPRADVKTAIDGMASEDEAEVATMVVRLEAAASKYAEIQASETDSFESAGDTEGSTL